MHYFELPKLPEVNTAEDELKLWLALFNAETEDDLAKIKALEVSIMNETIEAYRQVTAANEFREIERQRERARHNEASALRNAQLAGERRANEKWQGVVAEKDAEIDNLRKLLAELQSKSET